MQGAGVIQDVVRLHGGAFEVAGDGRDDHRGRVSAKAAALQYEYGSQAALLTAHGIAQGGAIDFAAAYIFH